MNYKLIFKKALYTPGALNAWLAEQPAYRSINIHPYLVKLIPAMERYAKRTGNDRMLKELLQNIYWIEQRHNNYLENKPPKQRKTRPTRKEIPFETRMQQPPTPRIEQPQPPKMEQPKKPIQQQAVDFNRTSREYIVKCMNDNHRNFDALKVTALAIIKSERTLGMHDPDLWDGYACYFEAPELNKSVGE